MSCSILLVDDEKTLLPLLERYLKRMGHDVLSCVDAESALESERRSDWKVDVLVSDLTLPGMSGLDLAIDLLRRHPALLGLLCSGYPLTNDMFPLDVRSRMAVLQKPFLPAMLAEAIDNLLASDRS